MARKSIKLHEPLILAMKGLKNYENKFIHLFSKLPTLCLCIHTLILSENGRGLHRLSFAGKLPPFIREKFEFLISTVPLKTQCTPRAGLRIFIFRKKKKEQASTFRWELVWKNDRNRDLALTKPQRLFVRQSRYTAFNVPSIIIVSEQCYLTAIMLPKFRYDLVQIQVARSISSQVTLSIRYDYIHLHNQRCIQYSSYEDLQNSIVSKLSQKRILMLWQSDVILVMLIVSSEFEEKSVDQSD